MSRKFLKSLFTFALIFTVGFSNSVVAEDVDGNDPDKYVTVSVVADNTAVTGGETIRLAIQQDIYKGWHTYWTNPGDSGLAFDIEWDLPEGFSVSTLEWQTPAKITADGLTTYGYEKQAMLLQNLNIPDNVGSDPITLKGISNLLVCHDICVPETHEVELTLNGDTASNAETIQKAEATLPMQLNQKSSYYEEEGNLVLEIDSTSNENMVLSYIAPEEWGIVNNNANAVLEKIKTGFKITQKRGDRDLSEISELPFVSVLKDNSKPGQFVAYRLLAQPHASKAIAAVPTTQGTKDGSATKAPEFTLVKAIIFALLGGLILNLMPCVFPVLSMKALSLVQLSGKEEAKAKIYGLSYTAGILISFLIIVGVLIALKSAGAEIGWGFQLQNPIVISALIYLIFILGLNLAGFFEITASFTNMGSKLANQSGNKGAFFTGVLATAVATPCTAPFMGAAMGYALTQPAYVSLIVFMALGLGLALPYLALCFIPALRTKLPKPGAWMESFRQFLSFPMFLTAAFLVWVLSQQAGTGSVLLILISLIAIVMTIWLYKHMPKTGFLKLVSLVLLIGSTIFAIGAPLTLESMTTTTPRKSVVIQDDEIAFSPHTLKGSLNSNDPILINMTAAWCITCKVNERVALNTNKIQTIIAEKNIRYIKGDWTNNDPNITQYLNSFDRQGVPLYVYYGAPDAQTGKRPEPVILPQILTAGIVAKALK